MQQNNGTKSGLTKAIELSCALSTSCDGFDTATTVTFMILPSRSLSKVSADTQSVAGPVPLTVSAATRKLYSVPRSRPATQTAPDTKVGMSAGLWGVRAYNRQSKQYENALKI